MDIVDPYPSRVTAYSKAEAPTQDYDLGRGARLECCVHARPPCRGGRSPGGKPLRTWPAIRRSRVGALEVVQIDHFKVDAGGVVGGIRGVVGSRCGIGRLCGERDRAAEGDVAVDAGHVPDLERDDGRSLQTATPRY